MLVRRSIILILKVTYFLNQMHLSESAKLVIVISDGHHSYTIELWNVKVNYKIIKYLPYGISWLARVNIRDNNYHYS